MFYELPSSKIDYEVTVVTHQGSRLLQPAWFVLFNPYFYEHPNSKIDYEVTVVNHQGSSLLQPA
jgi:hypothetical protein